MEHKSINFNAKIKPIKPLNSEFTLCRCMVQGVGKNRNYSNMSKTNILRNIGTLAYIPVVGHLIKNENGETYFGSHDYEITCDKDGLKFESLTVPFGVVCENKYDFETVNEYGKDVEYLVSDVILWTGRYPELKDAIYSDDIWFNESMEIDPTQTKPLEEDSNYMDILDWTYSALCILGKADENSTNGKTDPEMHTEPCFINSKIEPYNFSSNEFSKLMADMKNEMSLVFENINNTQEGGLPLADETNIVDENVEEVVEETVEEITEPTVEETVDAEVVDTPAENVEENTEVVEETIDTENEEFEKKTFSSTYRQKRDALNNALEGSLTKDENGECIECISYWVDDFDDEFVYVEKEIYTQGDYDCEKGRFKYSYDETNIVATINSDFEKMIVTWLTIEENKKIQTERGNIETMSLELEELRGYKADSEKKKRKCALEDTFAKFDKKLSGCAEYETLKASDITMDITDLEEKLFAMIGKKTANFSAAHPKETVVTVPVEQFEATEDDGYGGILSKKYSN